MKNIYNSEIKNNIILDDYVILNQKILVKKEEFEKYGKLIYFLEFQDGSRKNITNKIKKYRFGFVSKNVVEECLNIKFEKLIVLDLNEKEKKEREIKFL